MCSDYSQTCNKDAYTWVCWSVSSNVQLVCKDRSSWMGPDSQSEKTHAHNNFKVVARETTYSWYPIVRLATVVQPLLILFPNMIKFIVT